MAKIRIGNNVVRIGANSGIRHRRKIFNLPPSVPGALAVSNVLDTSLTIAWSAATDDLAVEGYEYRINSGLPVDVGDVLTVGITGLVAGTAYSLQVRAYDADGLQSNWSTAVSETTTGGATTHNFNVGYIENASAPEPMLISDTDVRGVSTWAAATNAYVDSNGNTFTVVPIQESVLLADVAGTLANIDILFTGSAIGDYSGTPASELEAWTKAPMSGGKPGKRVFVCYSDGSALGGGADNGVGQVSRQSMGIRSWAGFDQGRDQKEGTVTMNIPSGNFIADGMTTRNIQGEGMSPFVIDQDSANHASQGYPTIIIERGNQSLPKPLGLVFTGTVAELCYSLPGLGMWLGIPDRQLLLNGPNVGSDYNQEENSLFLRNILLIGSGLIDAPTNFDMNWDVAQSRWSFDMDNLPYGDLTVNDLADEGTTEWNDVKNHLEASRGPLLKVEDAPSGNKMIRVYRPKVQAGDPSTDVWLRKWLFQSHPMPMFPKQEAQYQGNWDAGTSYILGDIVISGDDLPYVAKAATTGADPVSNPAIWGTLNLGNRILGRFGIECPLHANQGGGAFGHICPKTVKTIMGVEGVTGSPSVASNPTGDGEFEINITKYNHLLFYNNPSAKGDYKNTVWDVNGTYGPAVTTDPSSYRQLTHLGFATYSNDFRFGQVGHPFQEWLPFLYVDPVTGQLTNVRRPLPPDTHWDVKIDVKLNTPGQSDGWIKAWISEDGGPYVIAREDLDLNLRGTGINTSYHPTETFGWGSSGSLDFTGGDGYSYNLVADSGIVDEDTDSWFYMGPVEVKILP